jgi:hypothetical protein
MWAGIWIDERHDAAVTYLQAIAAGDTACTDHRAVAAITTARHDSPAPAPLRRPSKPLASRSAAAAVLARSSGHCEVFTKSCRYTCDRYVSRCLREPAIENRSPADLFAACTQCAEVVAGVDRQLATRWGYVIDGARDPASVPFYWRGSRWVLLGRDGWLTEIREDAQTA